MPMSKRRSPPSKCLEFFRLSKPVWIPIVLIFFIAILTIIFEYIPNASKSSVDKLILEASKSLKPHSLSYYLERFPPWVPFWNVGLPKGSIDPRLPSVRELDRDAKDLFRIVEGLRETKFFRIFKVNLAKDCPFWARREVCSSPASCTVCECLDEDVPMRWKNMPVENFVDRGKYINETIVPWGGQELEDDDLLGGSGGLVVPKQEKHYYNYKEKSGVLVDPSFPFPQLSDEESSSSIYVDLTLNRPGWTGYKGRPIWNLIYRENCMGEGGNPLQNVQRVSGGAKCTEEESFYKIFSGIQTLIMTMSCEYHHSHLSPMQKLEWLEEMKATKQLITEKVFKAQSVYDLGMFKRELAGRTEWMENLYFVFGVLMKTVCNISPLLETCGCNTDSPADDALSRSGLRTLLSHPFHVCEDSFLNEPLFDRTHDLAIKQFYNISRILDCVDCEKCRLLGKLKMLALGVALKKPSSTNIERNEVIALVNTLGHLADGILILKRFELRLTILKVLWSMAGTLIIGGMLFGIYIKFFKSVHQSKDKAT